eukprot:TRINITY_DN44607_c0_g1_i1.p1 TRINITY_DN44607_c0_g1~~TRINITY_DN44607_c0_g1_i1.p1  ORF type:complete len:595 (-),score=79.69 TRINITY_DN44607_c0_g1_i1:129-1913(-)
MADQGQAAGVPSRCAECGTLLSDALVLACGHDLCLHCAAQALRQTRSSTGRAVRCLLCSGVTELCEEAAFALNREAGRVADRHEPPNPAHFQSQPSQPSQPSLRSAPRLGPPTTVATLGSAGPTSPPPPQSQTVNVGGGAGRAHLNHMSELPPAAGGLAGLPIPRPLASGAGHLEGLSGSPRGGRAPTDAIASAANAAARTGGGSPPRHQAEAADGDLVSLQGGTPRGRRPSPLAPELVAGDRPSAGSGASPRSRQASVLQQRPPHRELVIPGEFGFHGCPEHPNEAATYFCATCECLCVCSECIVHGPHRSHEVMRVGRAAEALRARAGALLDEALALEDDFAVVTDKLAWRRKDIERAAARGRASVRSAFARVRAQLADREAELLESLDTYENDSLTRLETGSSDHEARLNELRRLQDTLRARCRSGDAVEALNAYATAKAAIVKLRDAFQKDDINVAGSPEEFIGLAGSARAELDLHAEGLASLEEAVASLCERGAEFQAQTGGVVSRAPTPGERRTSEARRNSEAGVSSRMVGGAPPLSAYGRGRKEDDGSKLGAPQREIEGLRQQRGSYTGMRDPDRLGGHSMQNAVLA